jgi:hypothetical protein
MARFEPLILGLWVDCSTTELPGHNLFHKHFYRHFISPGANGQIRTLDLGIMSWVFNRCSTRAQTFNNSNLLQLSLSHHQLARFEPPLFGLWVECSTTVLPRINLWTSILFAILSLSVPAAGFKPSIIGTWVEFSTTVILQLIYCTDVICIHFFSLVPQPGFNPRF